MTDQTKDDTKQTRFNAQELTTDTLIKVVQACINEYFFRNPDMDNDWAEPFYAVLKLGFSKVPEVYKFDITKEFLCGEIESKLSVKELVEAIVVEDLADDMLLWLYAKTVESIIQRHAAKKLVSHKAIANLTIKLVSALKIPRVKRRRLPDTRKSITQKFSVGGVDGYVTVGLYPEGVPGEMFLVVAKQGTILRGLLDCLAIAVSIGLQYGIPIDVYVEKFAFTRFGPGGVTGNKDVPMASSLLDFVFRWLGVKFVDEYKLNDLADQKDESLREQE